MPEALIDVIILAGGKGTRLQSVVSGVPKPLAPVAGRPFLDYQFDLLRAAPSLGRVVLAIGHLAERVVSHYSGARKPPFDLAFAVEAELLGTAGAVRNALPLTSSAQVLVMNGDSIFHWDIEALHARHRESGAQATLSLLEVDDVSRYGAVTAEKGWVTAFQEKSDVARPGVINAGVYLFERAVLEGIAANQVVSMERDVLPALADCRTLAALAFKSDFIDIGLPETYKLAETFVPRLLEPSRLKT
jgi:NDP-sugar pyrophosphorylase family protein